MATTSIKRLNFKKFLNTTPGATATYALIGDGVTTGVVNYNPNVSTETYIHMDSASISVDSYAPNLPIEATCKKDDPVFEFIDNLRKARAVLSDAETDMVMVYLYETPVAGEYPAEKQPVCIQIDTFGGEGGASNKINYTINFVGDAIPGTFNPTTKVFTPNP